MSVKLSASGEVKGSYFGVTAGLGASVAVNTMSNSKVGADPTDARLVWWLKPFGAAPRGRLAVWRS